MTNRLLIARIHPQKYHCAPFFETTQLQASIKFLVPFPIVFVSPPGILLAFTMLCRSFLPRMPQRLSYTTRHHRNWLPILFFIGEILIRYWCRFGHGGIIGSFDGTWCWVIFSRICWLLVPWQYRWSWWVITRNIVNALMVSFVYSSKSFLCSIMRSHT